METSCTPKLVRRITDHRALEDRRRLAVQRVLEGETQAAVARSLMVSLKSVGNWMSWYRAAGEAGLRALRHDGPRPKLTLAQEAEVRSWLVQDPTAFGFRTSLWSAPRIVRLIRDRFGVDYNPNYFCRWLRKRGFSPQKPGKKAAQRDEARIASWPAREWRAVLKKGPPKTPTSS